MGQAGEYDVRSGVVQAACFAGSVRITDAAGPSFLGGMDVRDLVTDEGAFGRDGVVGGDGLVDEVGTGFE